MAEVASPSALPAPQIGPAEIADLPGIAALLEANQPERGGSLSASLSVAQLERMRDASPQIVARDGQRVVGVLLTASKATARDVPIARAMLAAYSGAADAYVYGPVVVEACFRGRGLAAEMFGFLKRLLPGREAILFIRRDNEASLRAHQKMGRSGGRASSGTAPISKCCRC
jgi:hypothetical protein